MSMKWRNWPAERGQQVVEAVASCFRPAGPQAQPPAGPRIDAVVQRQLEDLHQVEVAGEDEGLLAEGPRLDAAAATAGPGVRQRLALAELLLTTASALKIEGNP